jgi:DNA-binding MarR family transcriptional regulator
MQQLQSETDSRPTAERCARTLLASAPRIMRFIRDQVRENRRARLSMVQFRTLAMLTCADGLTLSALSARLELSLPATSRMVDALVKRGLLKRRTQAADRRRVALSLARKGRAAFQSAHEATQAALAARFGALPAADVEFLGRALAILGGVFAPESCGAPCANPGAATTRARVES